LYFGVKQNWGDACMKKRFPVFFLLGCVLLGALSAVAQKKVVIRDAVISVKVMQGLRLQADNDESKSSSKRWLKISVTYALPLSGTKKSTNWLDDVTVKVDVLYPSYYRGKDVTAILSGKVVYWSLALDGEKHVADFYIPPQVIQRYSQPNTKIKNSLKKSAVRISFYDNQQQLLGRAYYSGNKKTSDATVAKSFATAEKLLGLLKLPGTVLARNKTPWENFNPDAYDLIKTEEK
jgi:hypothetical protein